MAEERAQRRLAAILAADVVGYSRLMERDETGTLAALADRRKVVLEPLFAKYRGRVVHLMGDGTLAEFASAVDAVQCAVDIRKAMKEANATLPEDRAIVLRVGLNLGDVVVDGDDLYGDGVNIAARLEAMAEPGGICLSAAIHQQVERLLPFAFTDLGDQALKNIARPVRVYCIADDDGAAGAVRPGPSTAGASTPGKPSIAVLPFVNMSGDPEQEYFSDGITEDIITDLSKMSGLFVIARNSSFTYRGRAVKVQDVSRELGIRFVLEGSVRKVGNRVRIAVQLVDGTTGGHLWAERYDRDLTDIFAVQDEVTREIVAALALKLTQGEQRRLARKDTDNLEAYDCYLRGRQLQWRASKAANDEARILLERAIAIDPQFTAAYVRLACVHVLDYANRWRDQPEESQRTAQELAQKAVALDDTAAEAHWVLGLVYLGHGQLDRAMAEARKALTLDPNLASAHSLLGQLLHYAGRSRDAIESLTTALRLDPYDQDLYLHFLAQAYFGLGRYEEAAANLRRRIVRKPDTDLSRVLLAACYGHLGRSEEGQALWQEVLKINPDYSFEHHRRGLPYKDPADLERIAEGLRKAGVPV
jgi:TolB-like protein/class 3 adenylate cyclase/cytochrome c-type biogenesis protein CcmH/NrfG